MKNFLIMALLLFYPLAYIQCDRLQFGLWWFLGIVVIGLLGTIAKGGKE